MNIGIDETIMQKDHVQSGNESEEERENMNEWTRCFSFDLSCSCEEGGSDPRCTSFVYSFRVYSTQCVRVKEESLSG